MQVRLTVVDPARHGGRVDAVLTAGSGTDIQQVKTALLQSVGRSPEDDVPLFVDGRPLDDHAVIGVPPLVSGALVTVGRPGSGPGRASGEVGGFLELHVVGGPDAGRIYRLSPGRHVIGRAGEGVLRIADPDCSRSHAEVRVAASGMSLRDLGSTNGTRVDGDPVGAVAVPVTERSRMLLGSSTLVLRVPDGFPAATQHRGDGCIDVNRSPRIRSAVEGVEIRLPEPPASQRAVRLPLVAMLVPLAIAVPMALWWSPLALLFALTSPVMLLANALGDKLSGRREHLRKLDAHRVACEDSEQRLGDAIVTEVLQRRQAAPDAAELLTIATGPLLRIWERRPVDDDFLSLRAGTATLLSSISVVEAAAGSERTNPALDDVPVTVPLLEIGVLGVTGPRDRCVALVRSWLAQVAALHSPRDVVLVVLAGGPGVAPGAPADPGSREEWAGVSWLPHTLPKVLGDQPAADCDSLVGATTDQLQRRVAELTGLLDRRVGDRSWEGPRVVVLIDGAQQLRSVPGVSRLLEEGPRAGIHVVCLDADAARLPLECRGIVEVVGEVGTRLRLTLAGRPPVDAVVADLTSAPWFEGIARALAPLRDATPDATGAGLPDECRLIDVLAEQGLAEQGLADPSNAPAVAHGWERRPRSTVALLGVGPAGAHRVDLLRDGPHMLVAGTTGAGKSELLQTLIAALALGNRPDEMGFVLIDYKGGSAFADCARLPHALGLVTDLDEHLTRRALESLTAELTRRERLLATHRAKDIEDYQALVDSSPSPPPRLGRLVLVIDEFRVLAEELPEFLDGLVRIAAVGRSLGIHLVLATQRPGGVVSADIKANVNLRIALRVRDATDSLDVLDARDAATIGDGLPGRALSRTGSSPLVEFQTARVGGHAIRADATPLSLRRVDWRTVGDAPPRIPAVAPSGPTDLSRLVDAMNSAAASSGISRTPSPWVPPLPAKVTLAALPPLGSGHSGSTCVPFGLLDVPAEQRQETAMFDLAGSGCLAVAGTARSGRTTLLRTLAVSAATGRSPADVAIYALDAGGGLGSLADLPHVGAVVPRDDTDRAARLMRRLADEVSRRQRLLAAGGFADLAEQRGAAPATDDHGGAGTALPYLLLLIDGWEALQQAHEDVDAGRALDAVHQIVRQGPGVGLLTVVTGDRAVLTGQLGSALAQRLVLRLADPADAVLAGVAVRAVPASLPPGRGLHVAAGTVRSVQVALLSDDPGGASQLRALGEAAGRAGVDLGARRPPAVPFEVPPMPERVGLDDLAARAAQRRSGWLPIGIGGDDVQPVGFDLTSDGRKLLVAGHPGSGRSTALLTLGRALLAQGWPVAVVTACPSPLSTLAQSAQTAQPVPPVEGLGTAPNGRLLGLFGPGDGDRLLASLDSSLQKGRPAAMLVDDGDMLDGTALEPVLTKVIDRHTTSGEVVALAGSTPQLIGRFHGVTVQARKGASGLLLGPAGTLDGDVLGIRTPRRLERRPGRGILVRRGEQLTVQVAYQPPAAQEDA